MNERVLLLMLFFVVGNLSGCFFEKPPIGIVPIHDQVIVGVKPFQYEAKGSTQDKSLSFSLEEAPAWMSIDEKTGVISAAPNKKDAGTYNITIALTDGKTKTTETFLLTLEANTIEQQFIAKTANRLQINTQITALPQHDVVVSEHLALKLKHQFHFDDITFFNADDHFVLKNATPTALEKVIVSDENNNLSVLVFSPRVEQFSQVKIKLPLELQAVQRLDIEYQAALFLPYLTIGSQEGNIETVQCPPIPQRCIRPAFDNEQVLLQTVASNIHQLYNSSQFFLEYEKQMLKNCSTEKDYAECAWHNENNYEQLNYKDLVYLQYGHEGHRLTWQIYSQQYNNGDWGSGIKPNIHNFFSQAGGNLQFNDRYVNSNSPYYEQHSYSSQFYGSAFYNAGHAYGFSHSSGMTSGLKQLSESYIQTHFDENWRKKRPIFKSPDLFIAADFADDMSVTIKVHSLEPLAKDTQRLTFDILTTKPLNYRLIRPKSDPVDEITLVFDHYPEQNPMSDNNPDSTMGSMIFVRVYHSNAEKNALNDVATLKFDKSFLLPKDQEKMPVITLGGNRTIIIPNNKMNVDDDGWQIRKACYENYAFIADTNHYKTIWHNLKLANKLDKYQDIGYLSITELAPYQQAKYHFSNEGLIETSHYMPNAITKENSVMCLAPKH